MSTPTPNTQDCFVCRKHRGEVGSLDNVLYEDESLFVSHASLLDADSPQYLGYVFVEPKRHVPKLAGLTDGEAQALGLAVTRAARALTVVLAVEHVYAVVIGDGIPHVHVHVVGRHPGTPREYWGMRVDEWPEAPRGDETAVAALAASLRDHYLAQRP